MLPDYIIYDELERQRRQHEAEIEREQPRLEMPVYMPFLPEDERREEREEESSDRGVIIMQM